MGNFVSPAYGVRAVPIEKIVANSYNPNIMAPPEMRLLELSIWEDGYTMPCVCYYLEEDDLYEIVDGYHRYLVMKQSQRIYDREKGMLPVTVIEKDISNRMDSTITFCLAERFLPFMALLSTYILIFCTFAPDFSHRGARVIRAEIIPIEPDPGNAGEGKIR